MGVKMPTTACLPSVPHSPSCSQALASAISSPSSKRRGLADGVLVCRYVHRLGRSTLFGKGLYSSRSCDHTQLRYHSIKRSCSANFDEFSEEELSKKIQELASSLQLSHDNDENESKIEKETQAEAKAEAESQTIEDSFSDSLNSFPAAKLEPPDWPGRDDVIPASFERKANSVELPLSLRILKRKKQWQEGFREAGESAYCSVKAAFSSMVFIIRELHSYTLQMREMLFYEDLQGILVRVQKEMHASFVWLFQQVFSHTPTLMVYLMILLANYSVYSMASNSAIAATPPPQVYATVAESVSIIEDDTFRDQNFDSSAIKSFTMTSSSGKTSSIGGNNGGGGKFRPVASGTDGDGRFDGSLSLDSYRTIIPDGLSSIGDSVRTGEEESQSGQKHAVEELNIWSSVVEEASNMQASTTDESLDHETKQRFVSPVHAQIEADDHTDYFRTELLYQTVLAQEPNNPLLLANYAQFLYLVAHDYDSAEEYFKRAIKAEPMDAEAFNKYASFLWHVRRDFWAAEEIYLQAISADPSNSYYAANYAHFLWNTGGEDTCFPLNSPDTPNEA